jgi:hypothetical protein
MAITDSSHLYDVERRTCHAERPGFRITELTIGPSPQVPWHYHTRVQDTFSVLEGGGGSSWAIPRTRSSSEAARPTSCGRGDRTS